MWTKAVALAPDDNAGKLELALARLALTDQAKRKSAVEMLEALRNDPKQKAAALRALIADGITHHESAGKVLELAEELQSMPEAPFSDRLNYLDILRQMGHQRYTSYLTELEEASKSNPANLAALIAWMNKVRLGSLAIDFANSLPPEKIHAWPVPSALADSYVSVNAWSALEQFVANEKWNRFDFCGGRIWLEPVANRREKSLPKGMVGGGKRGLRQLSKTVTGARHRRMAMGQGDGQNSVGSQQARRCPAGSVAHSVSALYRHG